MIFCRNLHATAPWWSTQSTVRSCSCRVTRGPRSATGSPRQDLSRLSSSRSTDSKTPHECTQRKNLKHNIVRGYRKEGGFVPEEEDALFFEHTTTYNHSDAFFKIETTEILPTPTPSKQTLLIDHSTRLVRQNLILYWNETIWAHIFELILNIAENSLPIPNFTKIGLPLFSLLLLIRWVITNFCQGAPEENGNGLIRLIYHYITLNTLRLH